MLVRKRRDVRTWRESDIRDDVLPVMERYQVLQGVCVHNKEAAIVQAHRQGFAIGREAAATTACAGCVCQSIETSVLSVSQADKEYMLIH